MEHPLVSIIIPTFNSQDTILTCLESIRQQTYDPIEIVVVDGGSSDRTVEICHRHADTVLETDLGMAAARLTGAKRATGAWIFHVDSDMELSDRVIEDCVGATGEYDALIVPEINTGTTYWARCTDIGKHVSRYNRVGNLRFLSRDLYFDVGGHNPALLNREDRELHELVKQEGADIGHTTEPIIHHLDGMGLMDILAKRLRYIRSLDGFDERSRVATAEFNRQRDIDRVGVWLTELQTRPTLVPGFLILSVINAVFSRVVLSYYRFS